MRVGRIAANQINTVIANIVKDVYTPSVFSPTVRNGYVVNFYDYVQSQTSVFLTADIYRTRRMEQLVNCRKFMSSVVKEDAGRMLNKLVEGFGEVFRWFLHDFSLLMLNCAIIDESLAPNFILSVPDIMVEAETDNINENHKGRIVLYDSGIVDTHVKYMLSEALLQKDMRKYDLTEKVLQLFDSDIERLKINMQQLFTGLKTPNRAHIIAKGILLREIANMGIHGVFKEDDFIEVGDA